MVAQLGLLPWDAAKLQPVEIWALAKGQQQQWNQACRLVAWSTFMVMKSIPKLSKRDWRDDIASLKGLLEHYPPPGYVPDAEDRPKRKRR